MNMETAQTVKDLRLNTRIVAVKSVVNRRDPAGGAVKIAEKSKASADATISLQKSRKQKQSSNPSTSSCKF